MIISLFRKYYDSPLPLVLGGAGVWWSIPIADVISCSLAFIFLLLKVRNTAVLEERQPENEEAWTKMFIRATMSSEEKNMDIGTDLTLISRFEGKEEKFAKHILTEEERKLYDLLGEKARARFLAVRWACKEAIFKVTQDNSYLTYSVLKKESGKPYVLGHPEMKVSVSHDGDYVIATVLYEGEEK